MKSRIEVTPSEDQDLRVIFVFRFYNLIPSLTVREYVALVTEIALNPMEPEEALSWVGLSERLDHFPSQPGRGDTQQLGWGRIARGPSAPHRTWGFTKASA